jgi:hypothetical protein
MKRAIDTHDTTRINNLVRLYRTKIYYYYLHINELGQKIITTVRQIPDKDARKEEEKTIRNKIQADERNSHRYELALRFDELQENKMPKLPEGTAEEAKTRESYFKTTLAPIFASYSSAEEVNKYWEKLSNDVSLRPKTAERKGRKDKEKTEAKSTARVEIESGEPDRTEAQISLIEEQMKASGLSEESSEFKAKFKKTTSRSIQRILRQYRKLQKKNRTFGPEFEARVDALSATIDQKQLALNKGDNWTAEEREEKEGDINELQNEMETLMESQDAVITEIEDLVAKVENIFVEMSIPIDLLEDEEGNVIQGNAPTLTEEEKDREFQRLTARQNERSRKLGKRITEELTIEELKELEYHHEAKMRETSRLTISDPLFANHPGMYYQHILDTVDAPLPKAPVSPPIYIPNRVFGSFNRRKPTKVLSETESKRVVELSYRIEHSEQRIEQLLEDQKQIKGEIATMEQHINVLFRSTQNTADVDLQALSQSFALLKGRLSDTNTDIDAQNDVVNEAESEKTSIIFAGNMDWPEAKYPAHLTPIDLAWYERLRSEMQTTSKWYINWEEAQFTPVVAETHPAYQDFGHLLQIGEQIITDKIIRDMETTFWEWFECQPGSVNANQSDNSTTAEEESTSSHKEGPPTESQLEEAETNLLESFDSVNEQLQETDTSIEISPVALWNFYYKCQELETKRTDKHTETEVWSYRIPALAYMLRSMREIYKQSIHPCEQVVKLTIDLADQKRRLNEMDPMMEGYDEKYTNQKNEISETETKLGEQKIVVEKLSQEMKVFYSEVALLLVDVYGQEEIDEYAKTNEEKEEAEKATVVLPPQEEIEDIDDEIEVPEEEKEEELQEEVDLTSLGSTKATALELDDDIIDIYD